METQITDTSVHDFLTTKEAKHVQAAYRHIGK